MLRKKYSKTMSIQINLLIEIGFKKTPSFLKLRKKPTMLYSLTSKNVRKEIWSWNYWYEYLATPNLQNAKFLQVGKRHFLITSYHSRTRNARIIGEFHWKKIVEIFCKLICTCPLSYYPNTYNHHNPLLPLIRDGH